MNTELPISEQERAEAEYGEKIWREFSRLSQARRSIPFLFASLLLTAVIVVFVY